MENKIFFLKKHMFFESITILSIGMVVSLFLLYKLYKSSPTKGKDVAIANIIRDSSFVYLKTQYLVVGIVSILLGILVYFILGKEQIFFFFAGVLSATISSFFTMNLGTKANIATVDKAKSSLRESFNISFLSSLSGASFLTVCSIVPVLITSMTENFSKNLVALSVGVSFVSVIARLGGGVFTKGADVGADMVGKVEHSLEEDSPRNPAVIADNVGDNVGDIAGMTADLSESIIVAIASAIILNPNSKEFILLSSSFGIIGSIIAILFVRKEHPEKAITKFSSICFIIVAGLVGLLCKFGEVYKPLETFVCFSIGLVLSIFVMYVTKYYTDPAFCPVKNMLKSSESGHGANIIQGLAFGYESTIGSVIIVIGAILGCFKIGGLYGISIGIVGIMSMVTCFLTQDLFGPISDNAGGIAEMSEMDSEVRDRTDILDTAGNTTKAITKGYAIASALFASILMFFLFTEDLRTIKSINVILDLNDQLFIPSILFGGIIPFAFCSISMKSVSKAAISVVQEVRKQIKLEPGILTGKVAPDYKKTVEQLTNFSIKSMVIPALLPIIAPILSFLIGRKYSINSAFASLSLTLVGITIVGSIQSISMITSGGLWDNTKKHFKNLDVENKLNMDEKSKKSLKEAVIVGDTVGDPFKDTSGPSLNSVIKLASLTAILIIYCS